MHEDFVYADSDDIFHEINDFFNYNEIAGFSEYRDIFQERVSEGTCQSRRMICKQ